jgi:hypothetical protein
MAAIRKANSQYLARHFMADLQRTAAAVRRTKIGRSVPRSRHVGGGEGAG